MSLRVRNKLGVGYTNAYRFGRITVDAFDAYRRNEAMGRYPRSSGSRR